MYFRNKVVWITGASSGIGEALAYAFDREGARLILSARRAGELSRVKDNCQSEPSNIFLLPVDLADHDSLDEKARIAIEKMGGIDLLVNNGGISQRALAMDTDIAVDKKIMDVNYFGTIILTKLVLPGMIMRGSGHIAVVSSIVGKIGTPLRTAYAGSKHALHGFFDGLRAELNPHNIKITIVCPGYVQTEVSVNALRGDGSKNKKMDPATAAGLEASVFANKMIKAIRNGRQEVCIGGKEVLGVYIKRFFPRVAAWMLTRLKFTS